MVEAVIALRHRFALIMIGLATVSPSASGHVLDEYLQTTLVVIDPGDIRLKINLTPGLEIAEKILSQIDTNGDGAISSDESTAYAEILKQDLTVRLDGIDTQLKLTASSIPELSELRTGHGVIQMEFSLMPSSFSGGNHRLTFENRHFDSLGVYLFNAARPRSASIRIARQNRNTNQSKGEIEFVNAVPRSLFLPTTTGFIASVAVIALGVFTARRRLNRRSQQNASPRAKDSAYTQKY